MNQLYPFTVYQDTFRRNLFFAGFVAVFLLIFRPFGLDVYEYEKSYIIIGYGIAIFASITIHDYCGYHFFKNFFQESKWTVKRQLSWLIFQLFMCGVTCYFYAVAIKAFPFTLTTFFKIEWYVLICSILPITIIVLIRQNYLLKKNLEEAEQLNQEMEEHQLDSKEGTVVLTLKGDNQQEELELEQNALVYISAEDNYVELGFWNNNELSKLLMRSTLAKMEQQLSAHSAFFRCHRTYIVNLTHIISIEGNAQGYRLKLKNLDFRIPVSRAKGKELHEVLQKIKLTIHP